MTPKVGLFTPSSRPDAKMAVMKPLRLWVSALAVLLSACDLFTPTSPLSETCYTNPQPTRSAQLALGRTGSAAGDAIGAYVPGRLLVSYGEDEETALVTGQQRALTGTDLRAAARTVRERFDLRTLDVLGTDGGTELVRAPAGADVEALAAKLRRDPRVRYAEPDYYLYPLATPGTSETGPNDPEFGEQWHLQDFGLPAAWALETGEADIVLAVLDSGVDVTHEDLAGRSYPGCDVYSGDNDPSPGSVSQTVANQRHGTHVAGIALASGNNAKGVAGVAYTGVKLLPVKVFDDAGKDPQATATSAVARAMRWAAGMSVEGMNRNPHKANIINLSLGARIKTPDGTIQTLNDAVRDVREEGVLVIAASGNSINPADAPGTVYAPASAPGALAVGSIDSNYGRSDFSVYNPSGRTVDLMAPGGSGDSSCGGIYSTLSPAFEGDADAYGCESGTSMAAPFVAGVAALIWSQNPDLTDDQVAERLLTSARFTSEMTEAEYGAGVVCADRALGAATLCGK